MRLDTVSVGIAVVWFDRRLEKRQEKRHFLEKNKDSFDAELWSISEALVLGIRKTRNTKHTMVIVFTDSQTTISKILDPKIRVDGDAIRNLVYQSAHMIKNAAHIIVLRLVSSHSKIPGNERADNTANDVAYKRGRQTDNWSSFTYIKAELHKAKSGELIVWHKSKSQEKEVTVHGFYVLPAKSGINPILGAALKKYAM